MCRVRVCGAGDVAGGRLDPAELDLARIIRANVADAVAKAAPLPPGSPEWRENIRKTMIARANAVWQQPADPDEYLRHVEADCYLQIAATL